MGRPESRCIARSLWACVASGGRSIFQLVGERKATSLVLNRGVATMDEDATSRLAVVLKSLPSRGADPRVFPCTRCGVCCRNLGKSPLLSQLDRGDGVCRHLDVDTNLCRIYETRPKICRVTDMYRAFEDRLTWGEYVALNQQACRELQARSHPTEQPS